MAKIQRFVESKTWLWYEAEITEEQEKEYKEYQKGKIDEPEWLWDLDWDLVRDKPASDDEEFKLIEE